MGQAAQMTLESLNTMVGQEVAISDWFEITQDRINAFAEATEDRQWIHIDTARAANESPYGATIAHGFLTLSLLSHFSRDVLAVDNIRMRVNYGLNRVRFSAPVKAGARIRARFTLHSLKPFDQGVDTTLNVTVETEGSPKPCCAAEWIIRYYAD
jgi:acyl dehydratase